MFLQKKKKKKRLRTRLLEEITTLNVTVTQHRDLAPFLFCALFALRPFCSAPFFPAPFLCCVLFVTPFLSRPNVLFRYCFVHCRKKVNRYIFSQFACSKIAVIFTGSFQAAFFSFVDLSRSKSF